MAIEATIDLGGEFFCENTGEADFTICWRDMWIAVHRDGRIALGERPAKTGSAVKTTMEELLATLPRG